MLRRSTNTSPEEATSSPVKISKVVVFPAPFNPSNPKHSCFWIVTEIFLTAKTIGLEKYTLKKYRKHNIVKNTYRSHTNNTSDSHGPPQIVSQESFYSLERIHIDSKNHSKPLTLMTYSLIEIKPL